MFKLNATVLAVLGLTAVTSAFTCSGNVPIRSSSRQLPSLLSSSSSIMTRTATMTTTTTASMTTTLSPTSSYLKQLQQKNFLLGENFSGRADRLSASSSPSFRWSAVGPLHAAEAEGGEEEGTTKSDGEIVDAVDGALTQQESAEPSMTTSAAAEASDEKKLDKVAVVQYLSATLIQWGFILGALKILENQLLPLVARRAPDAVKPLVAAFFLFMSFRSRIFSSLDNTRPDPKEVKKGVVTPKWMPPGKVFPFVWTTIGVLRCVSSTMVWSTLGGSLCNKAIAAMMLHLSIGDTFNTINSVEKRRGAAVPAVFFVWLSVAATVYLYRQVNKVAGWVLFPSLLWITVANFLIHSIWSLNGKEPLYPFADDSRPAGATPRP